MSDNIFSKTSKKNVLKDNNNKGKSVTKDEVGKNDVLVHSPTKVYLTIGWLKLKIF